jgi:hypothetical protein
VGFVTQLDTFYGRRCLADEPSAPRSGQERSAGPFRDYRTGNPALTTSQTKDVVKLGDLKIQANEQTTHVIPHSLSLGVLAHDIILIAAGAIAKRYEARGGATV